MHGYVTYLESQRDDEGRARFAAASIARSLVAVRSFHRFCAREGYLPTDPSEEVGAPRVPQGIPKALDEEEVTRLLGAVEGDEPRAQRDRALLELLYATGIRISEAVGLDLDDIDFETGIRRISRPGWFECWARVTRNESCRSDDPRARCSRRTWPTGGSRCATLGRAGSVTATRSSSNARGTRLLAPGRLDDRSARGCARRARRATVAARPPAFLRDPHAGPRCRSPRRAGASRPRDDLDHAGLYQSVARATAGGLRGRTSAGTRGSAPV